MIKDFNVKYDCETHKSEYQCHMEWLRGLLINMQEIGVDDRYGDQVSSHLAIEIKWLTDKIELAKRENEFHKGMNINYDGLDDKENKVLKLINDIASCICYPNDSCFPNVKTVTNEFEQIFRQKKDDDIDKLIKGEDEDDYREV